MTGHGYGGTRRHRAERGGATVVTVACAGVLLLVGCALAVVVAAFADHRRAQAAADLAALAGAAALADGADGCAAAAEIAHANGAEATACTIDQAVVTVDVAVAGPDWLGWAADLTARARAGPAR